MGIQINTCTCVFIVTLAKIAKWWKQPKCLSVDEWINKMCVHPMEYCSI